MEPEQIQQIFVDVLNRAFKADPDALQSLVFSRVNCNDTLAKDPTICVYGDNEYTVGLVGILNGICTELTGEKIAVATDEFKVKGFVKYVEQTSTRNQQSN